MNTIDATPHISVGDVSPCSVRATRSLNWRSVQIPRDGPQLRENPRTTTEKLSGLKETGPFARRSRASARQNRNPMPCKRQRRTTTLRKVSKRICFNARASGGSSWPDRFCDEAWQAAAHNLRDGQPQSCDLRMAEGVRSRAESCGSPPRPQAGARSSGWGS